MKIFTSSKIALLLIIMLPLAKVRAEQQDTTAAITAIRAAYQKINTSSLTKEIFKYEADGCVNDGEVTYFLNPQKEIVKIIESGNIGDGSWSREFYFQSGKFFFCYEMIVGGPAAGPEMKNEYRTYVKNDQVLRYMENKKVVTPGDKSTEALTVSYKLMKAHTTKNFAEILCN